MYKVLSLARLLGSVRKRSILLAVRLRRRIARVNRLLMRRVGSPRAFIGRLGLIITCVTIFAPPAAFLGVATLQLRQRAAEQATLGARHVEVQLTYQHGADWTNQVLINVVHATRTPHSVVVASWLTDAENKMLMFQGETAWWPELTASMPVHSSQFEGRFHVAVSTRNVLVGAMQIAAVFLVLGLLAYFCFRRLPLAAIDNAAKELRAKREQLETQNLRFDAALNNMSQGLCMFDGEHRLVVCNAPYTRMYALTPDLTQPGTPFARILQHRIVVGLHAGDGTDEYVRELRKTISDARPASKVRELNDGRVLAIKHQPMPDGGWVSTHEDITEYRRIEARIAHMAHHDVLTELPNRADAARAAGAGSGECAGWRVAGRALPRPRSLQGHQRHARPPGRRRAAEGRRRAAAQVRRRGRRDCAHGRRRVRHRPGRLGAADRRHGAGDAHHRGDRPADRHRRASGRGRHQRRHRRGAERRHGPAPAAQERRPCALPRQGRRARHPPLLRAGHGRAHAGALQAAARSAQGAGRRPVRAVLPAPRQSRARADLRHGSLAALAPSRARQCLAGRVHSARRGDRPDRADRRVGAAAGLRGRQRLARSRQGGRQPLRHAVQEPASGRDRVLRACHLGPRGAPPGARDHRVDPAAEQRGHARHPAPAARARRAHRARRFRHRLFVA